jgi:hypothetical protein
MKSGGFEGSCLFLPAFFIETASMSENDAPLTLSINVGIDKASVLCWEGDVFLHKSKRGHEQYCETGPKIRMLEM